MICSTTYRTALSLVGAVVMTLGTFSMLRASAPWDSPRSQTVGYHNADLIRPADTAKFYKRIRNAAQRVCAPQVTVSLAARQRLHECVDQAVASAIAKIDHPQLNALHSARIDRWQAANEQPEKPGV